MANKINIQITYAFPDHHYLKTFSVDEGTMVQTAIVQSGILQQFNDIDLRTNKIGIFSRPVKLNDQLKEGDRIVLTGGQIGGGAGSTNMIKVEKVHRRPAL